MQSYSSYYRPHLHHRQCKVIPVITGHTYITDSAKLFQLLQATPTSQTVLSYSSYYRRVCVEFIIGYELIEILSVFTLPIIESILAYVFIYTFYGLMTIWWRFHCFLPVVMYLITHSFCGLFLPFPSKLRQLEPSHLWVCISVLSEGYMPSTSVFHPVHLRPGERASCTRLLRNVWIALRFEHDDESQ